MKTKDVKTLSDILAALGDSANYNKFAKNEYYILMDISKSERLTPAKRKAATRQKDIKLALFQGFSVREVAEMFNCNEATVYSCRKELPPLPKTAQAGSKKHKVFAEFQTDKTDEEIAEMFGLKVSTVNVYRCMAHTGGVLQKETQTEKFESFAEVFTKCRFSIQDTALSLGWSINKVKKAKAGALSLGYLNADVIRIEKEKIREEKERAKALLKEPRRPKLDPLIIKEMVSAVEAGASYNAVGKQYNVSHGRVKWYCDKYGVSSSHKSYNDNKKLSDEQVSEIIEKVWYGTPITVVAAEYNVQPLAVEHHVKKSEIGLEFYPLNSLEKDIFSYIGKKTTKEIAAKYNITVNKVREICSERGISLRVTGRLWTPLEIEALMHEIKTANDENRPIHLTEMAVLTSRTPAAVSTRIQVLYKQYPFLRK